MTPERLQSWIYRPVRDSRQLVLVHEPPLGQSTTVATWSREDVEQLREVNGSQGEEVLSCAREHIEALGEKDTQKFLLQWFGERSASPLRTQVLKLRADENALSPAENMALSAASGDNTQLVQMIPFFLNHIGQSQRATIGSIGVLLAAYERTAAMQQKFNEQQQQIIERLLEATQGSASKDDGGEYKDAKIRALEKLVSAAPDIVGAVMSLAAGKMQKPSHAPKPASGAADTAEERKAAAIDALAKLHPAELGELVSGDDDDGAPDAH